MISVFQIEEGENKMSRSASIASSLVLVCMTITMVAQGDLIAYYPFDEGSGQVAPDMSGYGNDGTLVGNAQWVDGKHGTALEFDGSSSYVEVPDADDFAIETDITFTAWFRPNVTINPDNNAYRLMSKNNDVFFLFNYENVGQLGFLVKDSGGSNYAVHSTTAEWNAGTWYHAAGTFDGAELKIYINGTLEASAAFEGTIGISNLALWIGADDLPSYFPGAIDDVRVYNSALSDSEVIETMEITTSPVRPSSESVATRWGEIK
jgi:hypothetical protein